MIKRILIIVLCSIFGFIDVYAANVNSKVGYDLDRFQCSSNYQDSSFSTNDVAYFSHCMVATCENYDYNLKYYTYDRVYCLNGNNDPYYEIYKNGCENYQNSSCTDQVKYCSIIMKYDCTKLSNGNSFTTTTKKTTTKKTTTKKSSTTTTTTTTQAPKSNTYLSSLTVSAGTIIFNKDNYEYNINVSSDIEYIHVTAVPEDSSSTLSISGNENIVNGSVINILVTGSDGSTSTYKINVTKETKALSNNSKLQSLSISEYTELNFNSNIYEYNITVDEGTTSLSLNYQTQDEKSVVTVTGNSNLTSGSKVEISVTAEDGSVSYYNIYVNVKKKSNFIKILFIIIVILALLAGGYYIYKKYIANKGGDKYEYE